jgi:hypothetical protein
MTHIVAAPEALNAANWPAEARVLRIASDEVLILPPVEPVEIDDVHAIVVQDGGFSGVWLPASDALDLLERTCEWELPSQRPAFAQGMAAGLPMKLWLEADRVLLIVAAPFAIDLQERFNLSGHCHERA